MLSFFSFLVCKIYVKAPNTLRGGTSNYTSQEHYGIPKLVVTPTDGLGSALALPIMGKCKAEAYEIAKSSLELIKVVVVQTNENDDNLL